MPVMSRIEATTVVSRRRMLRCYRRPIWVARTLYIPAVQERQPTYALRPRRVGRPGAWMLLHPRGMSIDAARTSSPWRAANGMRPPPPLTADIDVDVCIVGAGIAGMSTAY